MNSRSGDELRLAGTEPAGRRAAAPTSAGPADSWAATPWAAVTRSGILQARCGRPTTATSSAACIAWRLSAPGGRTWRPCYACGSAELPVAVQAADAEVRVAVAAAMAAAADAT